MTPLQSVYCRAETSYGNIPLECCGDTVSTTSADGGDRTCGGELEVSSIPTPTSNSVFKVTCDIYLYYCRAETSYGNIPLECCDDTVSKTSADGGERTCGGELEVSTIPTPTSNSVFKVTCDTPTNCLL